MQLGAVLGAALRSLCGAGQNAAPPDPFHAHAAAAVRQEGHPADALCGLVSGAVSAPQLTGDGGVADIVPRLGALKNVPDLTALFGAGGLHQQ